MEHRQLIELITLRLLKTVSNRPYGKKLSWTLLSLIISSLGYFSINIAKVIYTEFAWNLDQWEQMLSQSKDDLHLTDLIHENNGTKKVS